MVLYICDKFGCYGGVLWVCLLVRLVLVVCMSLFGLLTCFVVLMLCLFCWLLPSLFSFGCYDVVG